MSGIGVDFVAHHLRGHLRFFGHEQVAGARAHHRDFAFARALSGRATLAPRRMRENIRRRDARAGAAPPSPREARVTSTLLARASREATMAEI